MEISEVLMPNKAEEAVKQFSNWILGISFALCSFLVTKAIDLQQVNPGVNKNLLVVVLILSMLSAFIAGLNKYLILNRDMKLSIAMDLLRRIDLDLRMKNINEEKARSEWDKYMASWQSNFRQLKIIVAILLISLLFASASLLITGIYILTVIL